MAKHSIMITNSGGTLSTLENTITNTGTSTSDRWQVTSGDFIVFYFSGAGTFQITGLDTTFWRTSSSSTSTFSSGEVVTVQVRYSPTNTTTTDTISITNTSATNINRYFQRTIVAANYGIEIYGPDGEFVIMSTETPTQNILVTSLDNYTSGQTRNFTGIPDATDASKIQVVVSGSQLQSGNGFTVGRSTANGGTISVTNNTGSSQSGIATIISKIA